MSWRSARDLQSAGGFVQTQIRSMPDKSPEEIRLQAEFDVLLRTDPEATVERMRNKLSKKIVLNSDDLFRILPRYEAHPEERMRLGPLLYPVARQFTNEIFERQLSCEFGANDTVVFTAGGSATGKSSILRSAGKEPGVDFIVDTTFSDTARGLAQVDRALASGRKVEIHYVFRDFRESVVGMIERALDPESGRIVPIDDMARTHFGAQRAVLAAMEKFEDEPRVLIWLRANRDGKLRRLTEREFANLLHPSIDALSELGQIVLDEFREYERAKRRPGDQDHDARGEVLHFSEAFYEAARSKTQGGRKSPVQRDARAISKRGEKSEQTGRSAPKTHPG